MSRNLILEIPEVEAVRFEALLDGINATLRRIEQDSPQREAEYERLRTEGYEIMQDV